ncbi:MAG: hypothetical protein EOO52_18625 [Gammaproteobacteria bacterium]|nr:MAG: hypothetical protein EOO52_18625 [Gammaproteobacteria bacterium]
MKKLSGVICLVFAFVFFQSAKDSDIQTRLSPVHDIEAYYIKKNEEDIPIVDNDGNMYQTIWDVSHLNADEIKETKKMCAKKIFPKMVLNNATEISEILESDIKPSLFKEYGQCFISAGFKLIGKDGFLPDRFLLSMSRKNSKSSSQAVGGHFYIIKKHAKYIDVYKDVIQCQESAFRNNHGLEEFYDDTYSYVSIKPYINYMKSCLTDTGYTIQGGAQE